jgi:hypothetical protein
MKRDIAEHWSKVAAMGCLICGGPAEIAHCHGGSVSERLQEPKAKGKKLPRLDWIVAPLCPFHHRLGKISYDTTRTTFEDYHGPMAGYLDEIARVTGVDIWKLAKEGAK